MYNLSFSLLNREARGRIYNISTRLGMALIETLVSGVTHTDIDTLEL